MRDDHWLMAACTLLVLMVGCQSEGDRVAEVAREAAQRQAEQSKQMLQLQNQVAEGSRRLVEAEAQARTEMAALHRDLQESQSEIGRQRDHLETERRQIAVERYWDVVLGNAITAAAGLFACLLPLLLCWSLVRRLSFDCEGNEALAEILLEELASDQPTLLPASRLRPRLQSTPRHASGQHDGSDAAGPASDQS
jgi:hypothetical protein